MYAYPTEYRMGEMLYTKPGRDGHPFTLPITEREAFVALGAAVVLGDSEITRFRIRTRCDQARVLLVVQRFGEVVKIYDLADLDVRRSADVIADAPEVP